MASDTSLIFQLVPRGEQSVRGALARTAAAVAATSAATKAAALNNAKAAGESNRFARSMDNVRRATSGGWLSRIFAGFGRDIDIQKTGGALSRMDVWLFRTASSARRASSAIGGIGSASGKAAAAASRDFFKIDNVFRNTARRIASMGILITLAIVAVSGHAVAFTRAIWPMLGVLAAVPAVAFAAAVGLGSLVAVFGGLGAAMKKTGGGAGNTAQQIAQAERRIEQAQRSARDAQEALNEAREEAADRLRDINLAYARANLDQKEAAQAVRDAQQALREARSSGDVNERRRAELALQSALISQAEVAARLSDVTQEWQQRNAEGVEGSREVRSATERQTDAVYELAEAHRALAEAQRGGGGVDAAREAYEKLAPAGRAVVDVLKAIGPAWRSVKQQIQQAALVGVADDLRGLSSVLLGQQHHLVGIGAAWNTAFRGVLQMFQTPAGAAGLNQVLGNTVVFAQRLGASWRPFLHGFMQFVQAGSRHLPRFGAWIEKLANQFDQWATNAQVTGKIADWIERGAKAAAEFGHWIRDISAGIGAIFRAGDGGPNYLADLAADAARFREAMNDPQTQARLREFFASARELGSSLWGVFKSLMTIIVGSDPTWRTVAGAVTVVGIALRFAADHVELMNVILPPLITGFLLYKTAMTGAAIAQWAMNSAMFASPWGLLAAGIALGVVWIMYLWNRFEFVRNWFGNEWWTIIPSMTGPIGFAATAIYNHWDKIVGFVKSLPEKIKSAASGMWDGIVFWLKAAINSIITLWNRLDLSIGFTVPSWASAIPGLGDLAGRSFHIPDIFPDLPMLDTGGRIMRDGIAFVHQGEEVKPAKVARGGSATDVRIWFDIPPGSDHDLDRALVHRVKKYIRATAGKGPNSVQVALGHGA